MPFLFKRLTHTPPIMLSAYLWYMTHHIGERSMGIRNDIYTTVKNLTETTVVASSLVLAATQAADDEVRKTFALPPRPKKKGTKKGA